LKSHRASTNRAYANEAPTELAVRSAKAEGKITKLSDGGWLQLWVTGDGAKRWRLAYRYAGRQKVLAIAVYPPVGLKEARTARQDAKRLLSEGIDPSSAKKQAKAPQASSPANTFEAIGAELVDKKRREGESRKHHRQVGMVAKPRAARDRNSADQRKSPHQTFLPC
jgi:hypothetical protein